MRIFRFILVIVFLGYLLTSCRGGSDSNDNGGTTGGSGESKAAATQEDSSANDQSSAEEPEEEPDDPPAPVSSSNIFLNAFDFNCSSNWGDRDGAVGIKAYTGSGTCQKAFPGEAGT